MFKKFTTLAVVATVTLAMPTDFNQTGGIPVGGDYPMPTIPDNFEASSYSYLWENGRLTPTNEFSNQRWSSALNKIYEEGGVIDADSGDEVVDYAEATDATAKTAVEYNQGKACYTATDLQVDSVQYTISTFFN